MEKEPELLTVLAAKGYRYIGPIGEGGSATCHLVYSLKYKQNFVCKQFPLNDRVICSKCELDALRKLSSPQIINLYDFDMRPTCIYFFLEYCTNGSLLEIIEKNGPLKGTALLAMCKNLLLAISYIHSNRCAHHDIKPANILIDRHGRPKLADFGIARFMDPSTNLSKQRAGTVLFMAPEILRRDRFDPFAADIWALGVTFYFIATGTVPWVGNNPCDIIKHIKSGIVLFPQKFATKELVNLIRKMLSESPSSRPTAAAMLSSDLFKDVQQKDGYILNRPLSKSEKSTNAHSTTTQSTTIQSTIINSDTIEKTGCDICDHDIINTENTVNTEGDVSGSYELSQKKSQGTIRVKSVDKNFNSRTAIGVMLIGTGKKRPNALSLKSYAAKH